jgi:hypothetical protein
MIKDSNPLPKYRGITGLSNPTGCCFMNAALQVSAVTLKGMLELEIPQESRSQESQQLEATIQRKMPQFWKFLNNEIDTECDRRELHKEIAQKLTEDFWYSHFTGIGINRQAKESGYTIGGYPFPIIGILLHQLEAPQLHLNESSVNALNNTVTNTHYTAQTLDLRHVVYTKKNQEIPIQKLIDEYFNKQLSCQYHLKSPLPPALVISLTKRPFNSTNCKFSNVLKSISLAQEDGNLVTYQPQSLLYLTANDRHCCAIIKKDHIWHEINDSYIFSIPVNWEDDLSTSLSLQSDIMIAYTKQENDGAVSLLDVKAEEVLSESQAKDHIKQQVIEQLNQITRTRLNKFALKNHIKEFMPYFFFISQAYQSLNDESDSDVEL